MKLIRAKTALSASAFALVTLAVPVAAQDEQSGESTASEEGRSVNDGELSVDEAAVYGGAAYATHKAVSGNRTIKMPTRTLTADQIREINASRPANPPRAYQSGSPNFVQGSPDRAAVGNGSAVDDLAARGNAAQGARANVIGGSADDIARAEARGNLAQKIRANKVAAPSATPAGSARVAMPADFDDLNQRGQAAQRARTNAVAGSADDIARLEARGNAAQGTRANVIGGSADDLARLEANGTRAQGSRLNRVGSSANLDQIDRQGRFAQDARGRGIGNTSNLDLEARGNAAQNSRLQARNVNAAARGGSGFERAMQGRVGPEGTSRLIGQGDAAQAARGRVVNEGQIARNINNAGGDVGRLNQAGRNAQAGRGIGRAAPNPAAGVGRPAGRMGKLTKFGGNVAKGAAIGIAATEGVKALTGAEMDDPLTTGFRYGSAIFDKDVTMGDVARDRWQHHKRNFSKIGETLTTKGKLKENMRTYGADKREKIGNATGMELVAMRDTGKRYSDALKGPNKIKNVGQVAGDRAKHHWDNTKKVGSKVGCGLGNLFRKKENDKDC